MKSLEFQNTFFSSFFTQNVTILTFKDSSFFHPQVFFLESLRILTPLHFFVLYLVLNPGNENISVFHECIFTLKVLSFFSLLLFL